MLINEQEVSNISLGRKQEKYYYCPIRSEHTKVKRTLIYYDTVTQSANYCGKPLRQATKRHVNNSLTVKINHEKEVKKRGAKKLFFSFFSFLFFWLSCVFCSFCLFLFYYPIGLSNSESLFPVIRVKYNNIMSEFYTTVTTLGRSVEE